MLSTLASIAPVFAMILAGYAAAKIGIVPAAASRELNRFVIWIPLPALLFSIVAGTDWPTLWDGEFAIASLAGSIIIFAVGMAIGRLRGLPLADLAVDGLNASYYNGAYLGLPLFLLALGPASAPYVIVATLLTLTLLFIGAVLMIELGHHRHLGFGHALAKAVIGVLRNPVTAAPLAGFAWWWTGWTIPLPVDRFLHLLGAAASPTALVAIGLFLAERPLIESMANRSVLALTGAKLILHPAITAVIAYPILGMRPFTAALVVAVAALPTGTGPFMVTSFYARDGRVTSGTILLSTMLSLFTITALLYFLPR